MTSNGNRHLQRNVWRTPSPSSPKTASVPLPLPVIPEASSPRGELCDCSSSSSSNESPLDNHVNASRTSASHRRRMTMTMTAKLQPPLFKLVRQSKWDKLSRILKLMQKKNHHHHNNTHNESHKSKSKHHFYYNRSRNRNNNSKYDIQQRDEAGLTLLGMAIIHNAPLHIIQLIIHIDHSQLYAVDDVICGVNSLHLACMMGSSSQIVSYILHQSEKGEEGEIETEIETKTKTKKRHEEGIIEQSSSSLCPSISPSSSLAWTRDKNRKTPLHHATECLCRRDDDIDLEEGLKVMDILCTYNGTMIHTMDDNDHSPLDIVHIARLNSTDSSHSGGGGGNGKKKKRTRGATKNQKTTEEEEVEYQQRLIQICRFLRRISFSVYELKKKMWEDGTVGDFPNSTIHMNNNHHHHHSKNYFSSDQRQKESDSMIHPRRYMSSISDQTSSSASTTFVPSSLLFDQNQDCHYEENQHHHHQDLHQHYCQDDEDDDLDGRDPPPRPSIIDDPMGRFIGQSYNGAFSCNF